MKLTKTQIHAHEIYVKNGYDAKKTSIALGVTVPAIKKTLFNAARAGLNVSPEFCKHLPTGMALKGATIQINSDGEFTQAWYKGSEIQNSIDNIADVLKKRIDPVLVNPKFTVSNNKDCQLEWTLSDVHYGMLAWGKESGNNYDSKIARKIVLESAAAVKRWAGNVEETCLVLLGDNFHSDFFDSRTEASGHSLSVDSRYNKMVYTGTEMFVDVILCLLTFSNKVKVIVLYGNHDKQTSSVLPLILKYAFMNNKRVSVSTSPAKHQFNIWGCNATIYHHGDRTKPERVCSELNRHLIENDIVGIRERHAKQGHLHREEIRDIDGVIFERVTSPVAKDAFASGSNFNNRRASVATLYHKKYGDQGRYTITPRFLEMIKNKY